MKPSSSQWASSSIGVYQGERKSELLVTILLECALTYIYYNPRDEATQCPSIHLPTPSLYYGFSYLQV